MLDNIKKETFHCTLKPNDKRHLDFDASVNMDIWNTIIEEYQKIRDNDFKEIDTDQESRNYDYEYIKKKVMIQYNDDYQELERNIEKFLFYLFQYYNTNVQKSLFEISEANQLFQIFDLYSWGATEVKIDKLKDSVMVEIGGRNIELFLNEDDLSIIPSNSIITNIRLVNMSNVIITYAVF